MTDEEAPATTEAVVDTTTDATGASDAPRSTVYEGGPEMNPAAGDNDVVDQTVDQSNVDTPPKKGKGCCHMHWHQDWKTYVLVLICILTFGMVAGFAYWWATAETVEAGQSAELITPLQCTQRNGVVFGGYCYTLNTTSTENMLGWNDAEQYCRDGAGNLASILTPEENVEVGKLVGTNQPSDGANKEVWIGMFKNDGIRESYWVFQWSDGSAKLSGDGWKKPYAAWANGEPDPTSGFQDCAYMEAGSASDPVWKMVGGTNVPNDCDQMKKYFVCKYPLASNPGRPANVSASSGEGSIILDWAYPVSDGGRPITKYVVKVMPNVTDEFPLLTERTEEFVITNENNCTECSWEVTGLQPTALYAASISAVNEVGSSAFQDADPYFTRAGERAPDAPNLIYTQEGNAACNVKFDKYPPSYDGGFAVTAYVITATPDDGTAAQVMTQTDDDLLKEMYLIGGLDNTKTYQVTVQARNSIGISAASNAMPCAPSDQHPTVPTLVSITTGFREVTINFDQGQDTYTIKAYADPVCEYFDGSNSEENTCPDRAMSVTSNAQSGTLTISGLVTLQPYLFYLQSSNFLGDEELLSSPAYLSANELNSVAFTEPTNPGPVENVRLSGGQASGVDFTIAFDYPTENGDSPLKMIMLDLYYLNYTMPAGNDTNATSPTYEAVALGITQVAVGDGTTGAFSIDGVTLELLPVSNYSVTITVENEWNLTSTPVTFEPIMTGTTAPTPPLNVMATAGPRSADLTWDPPADFGAGESSTAVGIQSYLVASNPPGMIQSNYTVTPSEASCDCGASAPNACSTTCSFTFELGPGSEDIDYEFYVLAMNDATESAGTNTMSSASAPSNIVSILPTTPTVPQNILVVPTPKGLNITYAAPADNGGRSIEHYILMLDGMEEPFRSVSNMKHIVVMDLDPRQSYSGTIKAVNSVGSSPSEVVPASMPAAGNPSKPLDVRASAGDGTATVSWSAPLDDGGADITSYTATAGSLSQDLAVTTETELKVKFTGLKNGEQYKFTVTAVNSAGRISDASEASQAVKPGAEYTTLEYVAGVSAAIIVIMLFICAAYTIWWAWVEKELCWDDGDPNTRENARKRKEAEMAAKEKAAAEGDAAEGAEATIDVEAGTVDDTKADSGEYADATGGDEAAVEPAAEATGSEEAAAS